MTPLQVSTLFACAQPNGVDLDWIYTGDRQRQIEWLRERRMIRKFKGRLVATRSAKRVLHHQISDWETVPQSAKDALLK